MKTKLSYSTAKKLLRLLPEQAIHQLETPFDPTPAMMLGTNVERAFYEGIDIFNVYPGKTRNGKAWEAFKAKNDNIVTAPEMEKISRMASVLTDQAGWLKEMDYQKHCEGEMNGVPIHGYTDFENEDSIFDLKVTDPTEREFRRSIGRFDYHIQAALYSYCTGKAFYWVCISPDAPHPVRCYKASLSTIESGMFDLKKAIELFKRYQDGKLIETSSEPVIIDPPDWVLERSVGPS